MNAAAALLPEPARGPALSLERARIARALKARTRYRYVRPQVIEEGSGWKIVSPCCSRRVDPEGGVIDIAWLEPIRGAYWRLHARDHARACWQPVAEARQVQTLLDQLCADPLREFWK